jgi:hypothetical protein
LVNFKLVSYYVLKGEEVVFQKYIKILLNTKRRISFRGSFCLVKEKAFGTRGENFKSSKRFAKTKHVVQMWSNMLKTKKQSMHIM